MVIQPLPSQLCRNKEGNGKKKAGDKQYKKHSTDMFLTSQVNISGCASQYERSVAGPDRAEAVFESQSGQAAISSSLPFEFATLCKVKSRSSHLTSLDLLGFVHETDRQKDGNDKK